MDLLNPEARVQRGIMLADVDFILKAYGYEVDIEEAIAPRDW
ncbi:DUF5713 family protein [Polyangium spumosum]